MPPDFTTPTIIIVIALTEIPRVGEQLVLKIVLVSTANVKHSNRRDEWPRVLIYRDKLVVM